MHFSKQQMQFVTSILQCILENNLLQVMALISQEPKKEKINKDGM